MKNALIAAVVSAVIASTTAAAATIVVTSKNIKNGTIQSVDISAKAKRALKGNRGARGPAGAVGARGPAGPGITDLEWVSGSNSGTGEVIAQVQCPAGKVVLSGGGQTDTGLIDASRLATPQGWAVQAFSGADPQVVTVQALCVRFVAGG